MFPEALRPSRDRAPPRTQMLAAAIALLIWFQFLSVWIHSLSVGTNSCSIFNIPEGRLAESVAPASLWRPASADSAKAGRGMVWGGRGAAPVNTEARLRRTTGQRLQRLQQLMAPWGGDRERKRCQTSGLGPESQ